MQLANQNETNKQKPSLSPRSKDVYIIEGGFKGVEWVALIRFLFGVCHY